MLQFSAFIFTFLWFTPGKVQAEVHLESSLSSPSVHDARKPVVLTETTTVLTSAVSVTLVNALCASVYKVTGTCRRRRGLLIDKPVFVALDDLDEDEDISKYLNPSQVISVEKTPEAELHGNSLLQDGAVVHVESSGTQLKKKPFFPLWNPLPSSKDRSSNAGINFLQLPQPLSKLLAPSTVLKTVTSTISTSYIPVATSTRIFIVQGCMPPLNFQTC